MQSHEHLADAPFANAAPDHGMVKHGSPPGQGKTVTPQGSNGTVKAINPATNSERVTEALAMIQSGETFRKGAAHAGCAVSHMHRLWKQHAPGPRPKRRKFSPAVMHAARAVMGGMSYRGAASDFGCGVGAVHRCVKYLRAEARS